jgi:hypothetical protein
VAACGNQASFYRTVAKLTHRFREGRETTEDDPRLGRPSTAIDVKNIAAVRILIEEDNRLTIYELSASTTLSHGTIYTILHDHISKRKICARWVLHILTESQKTARIETASSLLRKFKVWG